MLACLVVLTACQSAVGGEAGPATPTGPSTLEFRKVTTTGPGESVTGSSVFPSADDIARDKAARQKAGVTEQAAAPAALDAHTCMAPDPLRGHDDPALPLVTCDQDKQNKYVLEPAFLTAADVATAKANFDPNGVGFVVNITFTSAGAKAWADFTTKNVQQQVAIVLDAAVVTAPTINEAILGGDTVINGGSGGFTRQEAEDLAAQLGSGR